MRVEIMKDYAELSKKAARYLAGLVELEPTTVLGLPTGSTPLGMYQHLCRLYEEEKLDFSRAATFNLDEYLGLAREHPRSYYTYLQKNFISQVNFQADNNYFIDGNTEDWKMECNRYEANIRKEGGIDLLVLGIGQNGHIGFNEPASELQAQTHRVELAQATIKANSRFFAEGKEVPREAITMGVGTILQADRILLLANGQAKAPAVERLLREEITTQFPASLLHTHADVTVMIDQEAADRI